MTKRYLERWQKRDTTKFILSKMMDNGRSDDATTEDGLMKIVKDEDDSMERELDSIFKYKW